MKKHYKALVQQDEQISEQLKTKEGRELYWHSLVEQSRNYDLIDLLLKSISLEGDIIEFGVWRGQTTKRMAAVAKNAGVKKKLYACDSFEGFGEQDENIEVKNKSLKRRVSTSDIKIKKNEHKIRRNSVSVDTPNNDTIGKNKNNLMDELRKSLPNLIPKNMIND